jgi:hypothetical protein
MFEQNNRNESKELKKGNKKDMEERKIKGKEERKYV